MEQAEEISHEKRLSRYGTERQTRDSQVALGAVGAPAEMVLKVLARRARALLEDVARYHVLLVLRVPVHVWATGRRRKEG
jgi:hypothetical protein